jgi:hypothetical protein
LSHYMEYWDMNGPNPLRLRCGRKAGVDILAQRIQGFEPEDAETTHRALTRRYLPLLY